MAPFIKIVKLDLKNTSALNEFGNVGHAFVRNFLTTAQLDPSPKSDLWPEGPRYMHQSGHDFGGSRTALIIRYWRQEKEGVYVLDRDPEQVVLHFTGLMSSFGPAGMKEYLTRRYHFEYSHLWQVDWLSDDPEAIYTLESRPSFATLEQAAAHIIEQEGRDKDWESPYQLADGSVFTVDKIIANMGLRHELKEPVDEKYPGGGWVISKERFHLERDYPVKPESLRTVIWESDCKESRWGIETIPVLSSDHEVGRWLQDNIRSDRKFSTAVDVENGFWNNDIIQKVIERGYVEMRSVFDNKTLGRYVIHPYDNK